MRAPVRGASAAIALLALAALTACAPALPESVVPDTEVTAAWTGELTSTNAAAAPTPGNIAIAGVTRGRFGDVVAGEFVPDPSFGAVSIVSDDPFTVRYDLAEPAWSDGIPLDAADLLLGWAAASGSLAPPDAEDQPEGDAGTADTAMDAALPVVDEFARSIDVTFSQPDIGWQQAVTVPVPAHVVGQRAFGTEDAMEAKQAVIRAIQDDDGAALEKMSEVWSTAFAVTADGADADVLLSSGPFLVDEVSADAEGQSVALVPNPGYRGAVTPKVARVDLVPPGEQPLAELGNRLEITVIDPNSGNSGLVRELERQDFAAVPSRDGTMWSLQLRPAGVFASPPARAAFLRQAPVADMIARGGGLWSSEFTPTTSMLSAPGARAYDIVVEDSGYAAALGTPAEDAALDREAAGVPAGAPVCVLYDRTSEFASGAFAALQQAAPEAGWTVVDCGSDDIDASLPQGGWDAAIVRTPIPQSPAQIAAQWGTAGAASITGHADAARDELITQYAQTTDVYDAREVLAQIEATIVQGAVVRPLALNPLVTVVARGVTGVTPREGDAALLPWSAAGWEVAP